MQTCPNCLTPSIEGQLFCEDCGQRLLSMRHVRATKSGGRVLDHTLFTVKPRQLILCVGQAQITLPAKGTIQIGRTDRTNNIFPELDLSHFGGRERGVSRLHALIECNDRVTIVDMNSANGTYINGNQMEPHQAWVLRSGDEIFFGRLRVSVYFDHAPKDAMLSANVM
jgi:hypothetical protein